MLRLFRRWVPVTKDYEGGKFFVRRGGLFATPLLVVLIVVETSDLLFAVDSIPAILSITRDAFIVYTSNVFAILGLRSMYSCPRRDDGDVSVPALRTFGCADVCGRQDAAVSLYEISPTVIALGVVAGSCSCLWEHHWPGPRPYDRRVTMNAHQEPRLQGWFGAWSQEQTPDLLVMALLVTGFMLRFALSWYTFLNPDEILHYLLADQPSLGAAYKASLTTAHPPFLILFLYYWRMLGHAEWALRFPAVVAGTAFCWVIFLWLNRVANRFVALTGLLLLLFSPSLIHLSAEIRQYAFLLLFTAAALYFLDRAFAENSVRMMALSFVALDLGLLTHYSAVIFAISIGIYALVRLRRGATARTLVTWILGQVSALGLCAFLYVTHLSRLKTSGQPLEIETWLGSSIYHPGHDHLVLFVLRTTIRLFHFLFSQGAVGVLGFLCFVDRRDGAMDRKREVRGCSGQAKLAPAWATANASSSR